MLGAFITAARTLTIFPIWGKDTENFSDALFWFPVVGILLGMMQAALGYFVSLSGWNELAAGFVVLGGIALTRGMHADGLADMADGFWGGQTKDAVLRIMKDPNVGSFGVIALSGMMLLKWIAVLKLIEFGAFEVIAAGVLLARWVQVLLASVMPYARNEGGTAQSFVNGAGNLHIVVATLLTFFLLLLLFYPGVNLYKIVVVFSAAVIAGIMSGMLSYRKVGGVTGDVLGAGSEVTELFVWIVGAIYCRL
ncbi:MAG: adenosylcobinamide-GDP ribazoletransferase [Chlorobium sp.]|nr:MAG: adenosylcobinamide-GDP ribazoletransferase [Chlorobium sp.]